MAAVHRAIFVWFWLLIFIILLVLRLDKKVEWNYFVVFLPMWVLDSAFFGASLVRLTQILKTRPTTTTIHHQPSTTATTMRTAAGGGIANSSMSTTTHPNNNNNSSTKTTSTTMNPSSAAMTAYALKLRRGSTASLGIVLALIFQILLCIRLQYDEEIPGISLYYVMVPFWLLLLVCIGDLTQRLVQIYRQ